MSTTICPYCRRRVDLGARCSCREKTTTRQLRRTSAWKQLSQRVRSVGICGSCLSLFEPSDLEADHIRPLHDGGEPLDPDNVWALCRDCHRVKTKHDEYERRAALGEMG